MSSAARRFTYRELERLPDSILRHEIIRGSLYMTPPPVPDHSLVAARIVTLLITFSDPRQLGRVFSEPGVYFTDVDYVQPDVVFLARARESRLERRRIRGAPDLIVEILSPSTRGLDRDAKFRLYRRHGVREYWIVDVETRRVEVHAFGRRRKATAVGARRVASSVLPGFRIDAAAVFVDLGR
jgi:Uma2 family endonuclease